MSVNVNRESERLERKLFCLAYLGGKCEHCGESDDLEFDHVNGDREDNEHCISVMIYDGASMARLVIELDKCQLLCKPCHWEKTKNDLGQGRYIHGTTTCYRQLGCRCEKCRLVHNEYLRVYRRKRLKRLI